MTKYLFCFLALYIYSASAATQKGFETEVYGFLRDSSIYSSDALASYNNINLSAPKHVPFGGLGIARGENKNSISHYTPYSTTKLTTNYQINVVTSVETGVQLRF
jgi:hypothetical protein